MIDKGSRKKNILKWVAGGLFFISIIVVGISWYISAQLKPTIKKELKEFVLKSTNGLYQVEFSDLHTNLLTGTATILDVAILPDTVAYKRLITQKNAPNNLYYIKLKK